MVSLDGKAGEFNQVGSLRAEALAWAEQGRLRWLVGCSVAAVVAELSAGGSVRGTGDGWRGQLERLVEEATRLGSPAATKVDGTRQAILGKERPRPELQLSHHAARHGRDLRQGGIDGPYVVLFLASVSVRGGWVSMAIGIEPQGCKHVLGLWPGCTAEVAVSKTALQELTARGLAPRPALLAVTDGAAATDQVLQACWGSSVLIAHCRERVRQEVAGHLAEQARGALSLRLRRAWSLGAGEAAHALRDLVEQLRYEHPGAAARLERSLEASLTVARLGLPTQLASHLEIAGPVRVAVEEAAKAAKTGAGVAAVRAGLPAVVERMRRLIGYEALPLLAQKLGTYAAGSD